MSSRAAFSWAASDAAAMHLTDHHLPAAFTFWASREGASRRLKRRRTCEEEGKKAELDRAVARADGEGWERDGAAARRAARRSAMVMVGW